MNAFFWIAVLSDAVILLLLLFLGMTSSGGGNGGREMAVIFGVVDEVDGRLASETTRTDEQKAAIIRVRKLIHS